MAKPSVTDSDIERLEDERSEADRNYNEALTRLNAAMVAAEPLPGAPAPAEFPRQQDLNRLWRIVPEGGFQGGWRGRVAGLLWRALSPFFLRQQEFNATLVDHLNQQAAADQQARTTAAALIAAAQREFDGLARFQAHLIQFLQQVTWYVDTKDRREAGTLRRQEEERAIALAAGLNGLSDELLRRWESMLTRQQRAEAALDEMRLSVAGVQRTATTLKRELERAASALPESVAGAARPPVTSGTSAPAEAAAEARPETLGTKLDSAIYVGFEDAFRGSPEDIRKRLLDYVPLFDGASDVLDIGCGRGEFLELLGAQGVKARGIDINHAMVEECRLRGLDVAEGDALGYLESLPDDSLGGALAIQVVEHLPADRLVRLLEVLFRKLKPGSRVALETINPACWYAFFASYIRDITHVHPIHPDTLRYLLLASGFQSVEIRYREPYPQHRKLQTVPAERLAEVSPVLGHAAETFNENVSKMNDLLFTYLDYAAIGVKG